MSDGGDTVVDVHASACGGDGVEEAAAIDAVVQPVVVAIDDWDVLVAEGR